jgi:hypothetical protein
MTGLGDWAGVSGEIRRRKAGSSPAEKTRVRNDTLLFIELLGGAERAVES